MRMKAFISYTERGGFLHPTILKDSKLVIEAQYCLYNSYRNSKLPFYFGCESDKYDKYLRNYFSTFKSANIDCYFVFKGGHEDLSVRNVNFTPSTEFKPGYVDNKYIVRPVFMKDICYNVAKEMGFKCTVSQNETFDDVRYLAQTLNCPYLSFGCKNFFSGCQYIPFNAFEYDPRLKAFNCKVFNFESMKHTLGLDDDKLALLICMTDENLFDIEFFKKFAESLGYVASSGPFIYLRYFFYHKWLAETPINDALNILLDQIDNDNDKRILTIGFESAKNLMIPPKSTIATEYSLSKAGAKILNYDVDWFPKGIADDRIAVPYINLFRFQVFFGSWAIEDVESSDSLLLSQKIVKYAYDLMTNFNNNGFTILTCKNEEFLVTAEHSVKRPNYIARDTVFEHGWNEISRLGLFEHFINETVNFDWSTLDHVPDDAKLLIIALIYFSRFKSEDTTNEICCVILSYVMLNVLSEITRSGNRHVHNNSPYVKRVDCVYAKEKMNEYFESDLEEEKVIFDRKLLHPLVEFQHCLQQMNYLNKLCGSPYRPTSYDKTYNGTFVYKVYYTILRKNGGNGIRFIEKALQRAPSVLDYYKSLFHQVVDM